MRIKEGTRTEKDLAVELGMKPETVLAVFHGVLSLLSRPDTERIIVQGFGTFSRTMPRPRTEYRALLNREVQLGGRLRWKLKPSPLALDWLRRTVGSDRSLLFRTGIIPELLHKNSAVLHKIQRAVASHTRLPVEDVETPVPTKKDEDTDE